MKLFLDKSTWDKVNFGDVVKKVSNKIDPFEYDSDIVVEGGHINKRDFHIRKYENKNELGYLGPAFHMGFKKGQILYVSRNPHLMKVGYPDFDGICSNTTFILESKNEEVLRNDLIPFLMHSDTFIEQSVGNVRGGVNPYVNWGDLACIEFLLPPIEQQAELAELLWSIDDVNEKERVLSKNISQSIKTVSNNFFLSNNQKSVPLGNIGKWLSGGTPSRKQADYWNGDTPWISPKDMKVEHLYSSQEMITDKAVASGAKLIPINTILFVVRGLILAHSFPVALSKVACSFNQDMKAIMVSDEYDSEYVLCFLQHMKQTIVNLTTTTTHGTRRLATETISELMMPLPDKEVREYFTKNILTMKKSLSNCVLKIESTKSLQKSIINQVF
ncbi:MAG: restriction endonuclease subunit S [Aliiglaciecola sp.]|uniref:restriction endonuclease subunit S n=1 Tax=Aliiglaciecola sp. TaxID=1872441 RepID=UPI0032969F6D